MAGEGEWKKNDGDVMYASDVNALPPVGSITAWAKNLTGVPALPANWVECNGQVLSDAESPLNGQTIPNLNASGGGTKRFLRGSTTSGTTGGEDAHALSVAELASHTHTIPIGTTGSGAAVVGTLTPSSTYNTGSTGSGTAHNTLPSYYEVVWIIKIK